MQNVQTDKSKTIQLDESDLLTISKAQRILNRAKVEMTRAEAAFNEMLCELEDKYDICAQIDNIKLAEGVIERASYSETESVAS